MRPGTTKEQVRVMFQNMLAQPVQAGVPLGQQGTPDLLDCYRQHRAQDEGVQSRSCHPGVHPGAKRQPPGLDGRPKLDADGFSDFLRPTTRWSRHSHDQWPLPVARPTGDDSRLGKRIVKAAKIPVTDHTALKAKYDFHPEVRYARMERRAEDIPELGIWASAYLAMEPLPDLAAALQSQNRAQTPVESARGGADGRPCGRHPR